MSDAFSLSFNALGQLAVRLADGSLHEEAVVVRGLFLLLNQISVFLF